MVTLVLTLVLCVLTIKNLIDDADEAKPLLVLHLVQFLLISLSTSTVYLLTRWNVKFAELLCFTILLPYFIVHYVSNLTDIFDMDDFARTQQSYVLGMIYFIAANLMTTDYIRSLS